jgi:putative FmdB family regulatory protein
LGFYQEVNLPLYEYACTQCGQHIEKIQKFSDSPLTNCEKCGGRLKKLLSSSAIQFKGTGWYITDYAKKSSVGAGNSQANSGGEGKEKGEEAAKKEAPSSKTTNDKPAAEKSH